MKKLLLIVPIFLVTISMIFESTFGPTVLWITAIGNPIFGAYALWKVFEDKLPYKSEIFKYGVMLAGIGLIGQAFRSWTGVITGMAPTDAEMPLWLFKDLAEWILITYLFNKKELDD